MDYKKHTNLTLLDGLTIEILEEKFPWFLSAWTCDAVIKIKEDLLVWKAGVWKGGVWKGGIWKTGFWKGGIWKDGRWWGGTWYGGIWKGGVWVAGNWLDGDWKGGYLWSKKAPNNH